MTSGRRDIEAEILRQGDDVDSYGQPSSEWASLASIWVAEDVSAGESRVSDRDQPSFSTDFTALEIDCRHLRAKDMVRVYYADYQIDAIVRVPGSHGMVTLVCSATQTTQAVPGEGSPDGDTALLIANHS